MEELKVGRVYEHFKGDKYIVEGTAYDSETLKEMVIYRSLYNEGKLWIREKENFLGYKNDKKRFKLLDIKSKR